MQFFLEDGTLMLNLEDGSDSTVVEVDVTWETDNEGQIIIYTGVKAWTV